jgi:hypothetical protein
MGLASRRCREANGNRKIAVTIFDNLDSCKSGILTGHIARQFAQASRKVIVCQQDSNVMSLEYECMNRYFQVPSPALGKTSSNIIHRCLSELVS